MEDRAQQIQRIAPAALGAIHAIMSGQEWSPDTLDEIADVLTGAGYVIAESAEFEEVETQ